MLDFDKPKKSRDTKTHNEMYQSDSGVPGTYVVKVNPDRNRCDDKTCHYHLLNACHREVITINENGDCRTHTVCYKEAIS